MHARDVADWVVFFGVLIPLAAGVWGALIYFAVKLFKGTL